MVSCMRVSGMARQLLPSLERAGGRATVRFMRELLILAMHLLVSFAKLLARAVYEPSPQSLFSSSISYGSVIAPDIARPT